MGINLQTARKKLKERKTFLLKLIEALVSNIMTFL